MILKYFTTVNFGIVSDCLYYFDWLSIYATC